MKNLQNIHKFSLFFIGIGGISMSGLAKLSLHEGAKVRGSDLSNSPQVCHLRQLGIRVYGAHDADNITQDIDLVIYSGAIKGNNPELVRAREFGIPTMERSEYLGIIASRYNRVIAISGTHGKTTTTAMLGLIMQRAGLNPTIHLGGESINLGDNTVIGGGEYLVVEACEYRESFRYLKPYIGVITNIELDHLDYYRDYNAIHSAFSRFANRSDSVVVMAGTNINHNNLQSIGEDWCVKDIEALCGGYAFNVYVKNKYFHTFRINCIGQHNITNALFAIATAYQLGIDKEIIETALSDFMGVERRYEKIAKLGECNIIIDYAHHPTELSVSIDGIESVYDRILYIFQPHTYSRTIKLFDDFKDVLSPLKDLIIYETYPAREEEIIGGRAIDLFNNLKANDTLLYFDELGTLIGYINSQTQYYDCVLILGAGDLADKVKSYYKILKS